MELRERTKNTVEAKSSGIPVQERSPYPNNPLHKLSSDGRKPQKKAPSKPGSNNDRSKTQRLYPSSRNKRGTKVADCITESSTINSTQQVDKDFQNAIKDLDKFKELYKRGKIEATDPEMHDEETDGKSTQSNLQSAQSRDVCKVEEPSEQSARKGDSTTGTLEEVHTSDFGGSGQKSDLSKKFEDPVQRLKVAETVMKKLYQKNRQLERELREMKEKQKEKGIEHVKKGDEVEKTDHSETRNKVDDSGALNPDLNLNLQSFLEAFESDGFEAASKDHLEELTTQKEEYLLFLAEEQDRTIASLRDQNERLQKGSPLEKPSTQRSNVVNRLQKMVQEITNDRNRYSESYQRMRTDYQRLLKLRTRSVTSENAYPKDIRDLVQSLEDRLRREEYERERDNAYFNMKLYEVEQKNCDWFVEKQLMLSEFAKMTDTAKERDALEGRIEKCMLRLFERLRLVESQNLHLVDSIKKLAPQ